MTHNENPVMLTVEEANTILDALKLAGYELQRFAELFQDDSDLYEGIGKPAEEAGDQVMEAYSLMEDAWQGSGNE
jgi:hypothetical protein